MLKDKYMAELREADLKSQVNEEEATKNEKSRQDQLKKIMDVKLEKLAKIDTITNVDEMPDSR